jgi:hypothetical protein
MVEKTKIKVETGEDRIRIRIWIFNNNKQIAYQNLEYQNCEIEYSKYEV